MKQAVILLLAGQPIISEKFVREERVLYMCPFPGSHTAITISEMVTKLLDMWNIECMLSYVIIQLIWLQVSESVNYCLLVVAFILYS